MRTSFLLHSFFLISSCLILRNPARAEDAPLPQEIENPEMLGINKEPDHATLMPYATLTEALKASRHSSSFCRSLNGPWKFNWVARPEQRPVDFFKPQYDVSGWKEIPVPSNWQVLGYGTPHYRNNGYIFEKDFPHVMSEPPKEYTAFTERNPVGSYRREFEVPAKWGGRRIFVTFDGVDSAFFLWINGEKVGYSTNSRNAAEFDITRFVKPGKNIIAAEVYRYCAGSYLEDQDMWRLSGIFRNVTLWSAPGVHIRDFFVKTDLDAAYRDGTLSISAKVRNYGSESAKPRQLTAELFDRSSKPKLIARAAAAVPVIAPGEEKTVLLSAEVKAPAKWTAETPNLYTTVLTLKEAKTPDEIISTRTGFRKIEIKGRIFTINGVPVKLKGANRHEHWPDTGHYVDEPKMIRDLEMLKRANCNHVRTCHYTDDPRWYELCDEWGIYLNAEANVESHGLYGKLDHEPLCEKAIVARNVANVESGKNHASIIMWSLGNECGGGSNFVSALKAVKAIDPDRPTHYEPFHVGEVNPADVDSNMYPSLATVERIATDPKFTKPYYLCEYAHAMFNSMGAINEYNELFDKYPEVMGGAIWEWQDQGLWNKRDPKHPIIAFGGGFGEIPNDHYFIHKGVVFSDRSPKPHFPEVKHAYQWIGFEAKNLATGQVTIRNKFQFIGLEGFKGNWTVSEDGVVIDSGSLGVLDLAAGMEKTVAIPFKKITPKPGAEYFLRVAFTEARDRLWTKAGYEVAAEQFKLPVEAPAVVAASATMKPVKLAQDDHLITVTGTGFSVVFDKTKGTIAQINCDGINLLLADGGPKLHLWRAPHQIDDMWAYSHWSNYGIPDMKWSPLSITAEATGDSVVRVSANLQGEGSGGFSVKHLAVYSVYGDGSIAVDNTVVPMLPRGKRIPLARLGVRLLLDKRLDQLSYLGRGPMENYADRKRGSDVGYYSGSVREQLTPYAKPMECGNHEDVRWAAVTGSGLPGLLAQPDGGLLQVAALPYTDEQMTPVEYSIDLPESDATVLMVSARTLGVGSAGCGPRPADIVWSDPAAFSYVLRLIPAGQKKITGRLAAPQNWVKPVFGVRAKDQKIQLTSSTPDARIEYAINGNDWCVYSKPFETDSTTPISVRAKANGMQPWQGVVAVRALPETRQWKVVSASSYQPNEGEPGHAFDGNSNTYWHTKYSPVPEKYPHELVIDFGHVIKVAKILYQGRDANPNGRVKDYEIYLSVDGKTWSDPAAKGQFRDNADEQWVSLPLPVEAQYLKFVALSELHGHDYASIAELDVIPAK